LRFPGIILSVLRLEDFLREGGVVFYQVFLLSLLPCTVTHYKNCKRLCEFEGIEISRQSCNVEVTLNSKEDSEIKTETEELMKKYGGADPWIFLSAP
jgi:hypothetical protein